MKSETNSITSEVPLCVDLDGTLIKSDMLYEAAFLLVRQNFLYVFLLPLWWWQGKANLKAQIANRVMPDVKSLPYRDELVDWLKQQKSEGRTLVLATASNQRYADAVSQHLGLFDEVLASSETDNLSGAQKADKLVEKFNDGSFDYIGNGAADIPVWERSRQAITVGNERAAINYANQPNGERFTEQAAQSSPIKIWFKALRVHQWIKNTLLFVPAILSAGLVDWQTIPQLIIAFFSFSFCASSVYLLNDLTDIEVDRKHRTKSARPIPSGKLPINHAAIASVGLLLASFLLSLILPWAFSIVLAIYYIMTCAYSFALKRMLLIDVVTLSGLFSVRILAGSAAITVPISTWLLAFSMFFFLSLALVKRFVELSNQLKDVGREQTGRGYRAIDLETLAQSGVASGFASVVVLALFIDTPQVAENYARPEIIWLVCPLVLYLIIRIWILARRNHMRDDPVVFLMTDWRSQIMIGAGAVLMLISQVI